MAFGFVMARRNIVRWFVTAVHKMLARSVFCTGVYMWVLGHVARSLPACRLKQGIMSTIAVVSWPDIPLDPCTVRIGSKTNIILTPHFHEDDFAVLLDREFFYEKETFDYFEQNHFDYDAVVDIGANVGIYSVFFAQLFAVRQEYTKQVFAFEPSRKAYARLLQNVVNNHANNIQPFNCAIAATTGFYDFFEPTDHLTNGSLFPDFAKKFSSSFAQNKVMAFSGQVLENIIGTMNHVLIKIDTEGSESIILKSLERFIAAHKPTLLVEVLGDYQDSLNQLDFLLSSGYSFFNITDKGLVRHETFEATTFRNYVLLSPRRCC